MAKNILIIDDEESIRFTFSFMLESEGYSVASAATSAEALAQINTRHYDLVFLDLLLGTESGITTLKAIKADHPDLPVVMITGAPDSKTVEQALNSGAFAYIPKPIRLEALTAMAEKALQQITDEKPPPT